MIELLSIKGCIESTMSSSGTAGGISLQPYRSDLTDRNHFYHSASVPHPAGPISSISANNSTVSYSAVPTQQTSPQNSPTKTKSSSYSKCFYYFLWILAQFALFGAVGMFLFWMLKYDKGFTYKNNKLNLHAFLMLTGFVFVNGQSILICKTYLCCKKISNKIANAFFFVLSIALVAFGMLIGYEAQPIHFYSLHSWIGLAAMGLFALQFVFGFFTFLVLLCCERGTAGFRSRVLPLHVTFRLTIFILACAACLTGILQTARSRLSGRTAWEPTKGDYKDMSIRDNNPFNNPGLVLNGVGACIIFLAILIPILVRNFSHNRRPETGASFRINH